jgi:hypothetical protein
MDRTVFLHIAPVLDHDPTPVTSDSRSRANIDILADDDLPGDCSQGMHKGGRIDHRDMLFKTVYHDFQLFSFVKVIRNI